MRVLIERDLIYTALQRVQSVVEKKSTVQILGNILCRAVGQSLELSATDLEVGVRTVLHCQVKEEGSVTLSAKHFFEIVKELPSKPLSLGRKSNDWIEILCGKSKFNIVSLPASDYPQLPNFDDRPYHEAKSQALRAMIDQTAFAVSTDATRYHLNGVYFEKLENDLMRMTATDGHRLSYVDEEVFLKNPEMKKGLIIPKKGLQEFRKILEEEQAITHVSIDASHLFAKSGDVSVFVRLIEGDFPDYRQVIPKSSEKVVLVEREGFAGALKRVSLLANEKSKAVKFQLTQNLLTISSSNPDAGDASDEVEVEYQGEDLEIGFNAKYLLEALPIIQSQKIELRLKDRLSPGVLQGVDQRKHSYIIMPMRV